VIGEKCSIGDQNGVPNARSAGRNKRWPIIIINI
jgi:hypothetical protein